MWKVHSYPWKCFGKCEECFEVLDLLALSVFSYSARRVGHVKEEIGLIRTLNFLCLPSMKGYDICCIIFFFSCWDVCKCFRVTLCMISIVEYFRHHICSCVVYGTFQEIKCFEELRTLIAACLVTIRVLVIRTVSYCCVALHWKLYNQ